MVVSEELSYLHQYQYIVCRGQFPQNSDVHLSILSTEKTMVAKVISELFTSFLS